jgi:hypothetical protein
MRRALTSIIVATTLCGTVHPADRKSWNRIRYVGGTVPIKTTPYDWNTTLTITAQPPLIVVSIAPGSVFSGKQTLRIAPSTVTSISAGPVALRRIGEVPGVQLPVKPPALFGLLQDNGFLGIVYQPEDGKRIALLLETRLAWQILPALKSVTGKSPEDSP